MKNNDIQWWGYRHTNGSLHVKRYFAALDIEEAIESPFVAQTYGPFPAECRDEALKICEDLI